MRKPVVLSALSAGFMTALLSSAAVYAAPHAMTPHAAEHRATPAQMHGGHMGGHHMAGEHRSGPMGGGRFQRGAADHVEGRIAFLKTELKITDAQAKLWEPVANAMRGQSAALKTLHEQAKPQAERERPTSAPDMLARRDEALALQAKLITTRAAAHKEFAAAFGPLYNQLNDEQKKTADSLLTRHGRGRH